MFKDTKGIIIDKINVMEIDKKIEYLFLTYSPKMFNALKKFVMEGTGMIQKNKVNTLNLFKDVNVGNIRYVKRVI